MKLNWKLLAVITLVGAAYTLSGCAQQCLDEFDCAEQSKKDGGKRYTCISNKCQVMVIPDGGDGTGGGDGTTGGGDGTTGGGDGTTGGGDGTTGGGDGDAGTGGGTATDGGDTDAGTGGGTGTDAGADPDAGMDMDAGTDAGAPATCSVCVEPACTALTVISCVGGETVCTIHTKDNNPSTRAITRACSTASAAQTAVAANPAACANIEAGQLPNNTQCTFACDGVNFPDCNHTPLLVPDAGGLYDGGP